MKKGKISLSYLIFMALCCDIGIFLKKIIAPVTNIVTDSLHIPGGIGASFSIMFIIVAAVLCKVPGCAAVMGLLQSIIALLIGSTGSMGILAPIGYIVPGIVVDVLLLLFRVLHIRRSEQLILANAAGGVAAALCANLITFNLSGPPLWLYFSVACASGVIGGILGEQILKRVIPVFAYERCIKQGENG